jgi:hypothetical protein
MHTITPSMIPSNAQKPNQKTLLRAQYRNQYSAVVARRSHHHSHHAPQNQPATPALAFGQAATSSTTAPAYHTPLATSSTCNKALQLFCVHTKSYNYSVCVQLQSVPSLPPPHFFDASNPALAEHARVRPQLLDANAIGTADGTNFGLPPVVCRVIKRTESGH